MRAYQRETLSPFSLVSLLLVTSLSNFAGAANPKPAATKLDPADVSPVKNAASSSANSSKDNSSWKLDQRSRVLGDETLFVSPFGVKVVCRKDGTTMLFAQPFSEVVTYCVKTKKFCRQPVATSENPYARTVAMFSGVAHGQVPMNKAREYSKGGLNWMDFDIPKQYAKERVAMWQRHEVTGSEPASGRCTGFRMPIDKRAVDWLSRLLCVPKVGVVPFDVTFHDVDEDVHSLVKTFSMVSKKLTASDFKMPPGLHEVKDPRVVIQDESSTDAIEMMMGAGGK